MDVDLLEIGIEAPHNEENRCETSHRNYGGSQVFEVGLLGVDLDIDGGRSVRTVAKQVGLDQTLFRIILILELWRKETTFLSYHGVAREKAFCHFTY